MLIAVSVVATLLFALYWRIASSVITPHRYVTKPRGDLATLEVPTVGRETPCFVTPGFLHPRKHAVFIFAHGLQGSRASWIDEMLDLEEQGYDSLVASMPAHDESPFPEVRFGTLESDVLRDVLDWTRARLGPGVKIVLVGKSLGGASAWLASEKTQNVDAIVSECAFSRFDGVMNRWFEAKLGTLGAVFRPVVWIARARTHIDPVTIRPIDAARRWKGRPALVIQGGADRLVLPSNGADLAAAAGCELWTVPGADHVQCYDRAPEEYTRRLIAVANSIR